MNQDEQIIQALQDHDWERAQLVEEERVRAGRFCIIDYEARRVPSRHRTGEDAERELARLRQIADAAHPESEGFAGAHLSMVLQFTDDARDSGTLETYVGGGCQVQVNIKQYPTAINLGAKGRLSFGLSAVEAREWARMLLNASVIAEEASRERDEAYSEECATQDGENRSLA